MKSYLKGWGTNPGSVSDTLFGGPALRDRGWEGQGTGWYARFNRVRSLNNQAASKALWETRLQDVTQRELNQGGLGDALRVPDWENADAVFAWQKSQGLFRDTIRTRQLTAWEQQEKNYRDKVTTTVGGAITGPGAGPQDPNVRKSINRMSLGLIGTRR